MTQPMLPPQFGELERFVSMWAGFTLNERMDARGRNSMAEIREFYDAAIVRAEEMLAYLKPFPLDNLPEQAGCVLRLLLGLVHASIAVEIQGQPLPPKTTFPLGVHLISGIAPFG